MRGGGRSSGPPRSRARTGRRARRATGGKATTSSAEPGGRSVEELLRAARARLARLAPAEAREAARSRGGLIVDNRSKRERDQQGLVHGARFLPRNVEWRADPASPHRDPALAARRAADPHVRPGLPVDMIGGFEGWVAAGLPVLHQGSTSPSNR